MNQQLLTNQVEEFNSSVVYSNTDRITQHGKEIKHVERVPIMVKCRLLTVYKLLTHPCANANARALTGGEVQRCGLAARGVSAVHTVGGEQLLDPLQLSAPAGLEQLPARSRLQHRRRAGPSRAAPQRHPRTVSTGNTAGASLQEGRFLLHTANYLRLSSPITQLNAKANVHSSLCNAELQCEAKAGRRGAADPDHSNTRSCH